MKPTIVAFFDQLGMRGHEPLLQRVSATVRFDIGDGASVEHRLLHIDRGEIRVTSEDVPADCTVTIGEELLDEIIGGRTGAMAAFLRGALLIEGDPQVLVLVQRLFRGHPAATTDSARGVSEAGHEASGIEGPPP